MKVLIVSLFLLFSIATPSYAGNDSPFTDTIGRNYELTTCVDAENKIIALGMRRHSMEQALHFKNTPEMRNMIYPKINWIDHAINDISYWMTYNCTEA